MANFDDNIYLGDMPVIVTELFLWRRIAGLLGYYSSEENFSYIDISVRKCDFVWLTVCKISF